jgi:hypothetical protein
MTYLETYDPATAALLKAQDERIRKGEAKVEQLEGVVGETQRLEHSRRLGQVCADIQSEHNLTDEQIQELQRHGAEANIGYHDLPKLVPWYLGELQAAADGPPPTPEMVAAAAAQTPAPGAGESPDGGAPTGDRFATADEADAAVQTHVGEQEIDLTR